MYREQHEVVAATPVSQSSVHGRESQLHRSALPYQLYVERHRIELLFILRIESGRFKISDCSDGSHRSPDCAQSAWYILIKNGSHLLGCPTSSTGFDESHWRHSESTIMSIMPEHLPSVYIQKEDLLHALDAPLPQVMAPAYEGRDCVLGPCAPGF